MRQQSMADGSFEKYWKMTRKNVFLAQMDQIIPWQELVVVIDPFYLQPQSAERRTKVTEKMLRTHFLQHWFELFDLAAEEALYNSWSMRQFMGIGIGQEPEPEPEPDEAAICKYRHLSEQHNLGADLFRLFNVFLEENGMKLSRGTIVDVSITNALSTTKNKGKARDPVMYRTREGN